MKNQAMRTAKTPLPPPAIPVATASHGRMKALRRHLALLLFLGAGLGRLSAFSSYYVSSVSGSDTTGTGSSASPWQTIQHAAGKMSPGDYTYVDNGIYRNSDFSSPTPVTPVVSFSGTGTSSAWYHFMANTGNSPVILYNTVGFKFTNPAQYIEVSGFTLIGPGVIANAGFETGDFSGWPHHNGTPAPAITEGSVARSGSYALDFPAPSGTTNSYAYQDFTGGFTAGQPFSVTGWGKMSDTTSGHPGQIGMTCYSSSGTALTSTAASFTAGTYTQQTLTVTPSSDTAYIQLQAQFDAPAGGVTTLGHFYLDDLAVTQAVGTVPIEGTLTNGDFETDTLTGWTTSSTCQAVTNNAYTGSCSALIPPPVAGATSSNYIYQDFTSGFVIGQPFSVSMTGKMAASSTTYGSVSLACYNSGSSTPINSLGTSFSGTSYPSSPTTVTITVPTGTNYIRLQAALKPGATANFYVDDFVLPAPFQIDSPAIAVHSTSTTPAGVANHFLFLNNLVEYGSGGGINTYAADYVTVQNNEVDNCCFANQGARSAISLFALKNSDTLSGYHNFIETNRVFDNRNYYPWTESGGTGNFSDGNGIIIDDNQDTTLGLPAYQSWTRIENNVSVFNGGGGIHTTESAYVDIVNNTTWCNTQGFLGLGSYGEICPTACPPSIPDAVNVLNNICVASSGQTTGDSYPSVDFEYNLFFGGTGTPTGTNTSGDPLFANASSDPTMADFSVEAGSTKVLAQGMASHIFATGTVSAAASSINGVGRPWNSGYDLGAYENTPVLQNYGFESGTLASWVISSGSPQAVNSTPHSGSWDLELPMGATSTVSLYQTVTAASLGLATGDILTLGAWGKMAESSSQQGRVQLVCLNSSYGTLGSPVNIYFQTETAWTYKSVDLVVPTGTMYVRVLPQYPASGSYNFFVDDISLLRSVP